jgi:hypothetical protein
MFVRHPWVKLPNLLSYLHVVYNSYHTYGIHFVLPQLIEYHRERPLVHEVVDDGPYMEQPGLLAYEISLLAAVVLWLAVLEKPARDKDGDTRGHDIHVWLVVARTRENKLTPTMGYADACTLGHLGHTRSCCVTLRPYVSGLLLPPFLCSSRSAFSQSQIL